MKRIIKSRLEEHMVDLYSRVDNLKKDIALIKNNHLKHMSCAIYKIEKKVDNCNFFIIISLKLFIYLIKKLNALVAWRITGFIVINIAMQKIDWGIVIFY